MSLNGKEQLCFVKESYKSPAGTPAYDEGRDHPTPGWAGHEGQLLAHLRNQSETEEAKAAAGMAPLQRWRSDCSHHKGLTACWL